MNNRLSVRVCDDDGNLMYSQDYRVRRVIQNGVIDDERGVSLDMEALGYEFDSQNDKWVIDEDKTTGKFLLVAEYDSGFYDETDICIMVPMTQTNDDNPAEFVFDDEMLYAVNTFSDNLYFALSGGADDTWLDGDKFCMEIVKTDRASSEIEALKFDSMKINNGDIFAKKDVSDETETVTYLRTAAAMVKSFKGKRWLCVTPLIINENFGCHLLFRRNTKGGLIKYSVVEVEQ